jgi:YidC/Oxa1 family membrane protein insertase
MEVAVEKRALIAVVLSIAFLMFYQQFFMPPPVPQKKEPPRAAAEKTAPAISDKTAGDKPAAGGSRVETLVERQASDEASSAEKLVTVETTLYSAVFSSRGGVIKSFRLKEYTDKQSQPVELVPANTGVPALAMGQSRDFSFAGRNFAISSGDITVAAGDSGKLIFEYASGAVLVRRTYTFGGASYRIDLRDETAGLGEYYITPGTGFGKSGETGYGAHIGPVLLDDVSREEFDASKPPSEMKTFAKKVRWVANEDKYFFAAIVPVSDKPEKPAALVWGDNGKTVAAIKGSPGVNDFIIFAGPKKEEILSPLELSLEHIVDFGYFSIIARPIFWLLKFINGFIGNWGFSIIALTMVVRIPFIPLISKGQRSMKKLQKIQPLMNEIREKYKKDAQRMQTELMELYKKHKVNPMGGCLPIVIQIPVFFALYKVLLVAIELRGAPFMFWIKDLSEKDPYYILPVVMGGTMFLQQKMTPSGMDPTQAKIMLLMPIIFTFMFLNFPSGLVVYWLVSNIFGIVQQFYVNKRKD